jgi:hypothetical protein
VRTRLAPLAVALALLAAPRAAQAFSLVSFGPESWGASDEALGFKAPVLESFEQLGFHGGVGYAVTDTMPPGPGLVAALPALFDPTTDPFGKAFARGAWDGANVVINTIENQSHDYAETLAWGRVTFAFEDGASRVGFSLTDLELATNELYVNGAPMGFLGQARGTTNLKIQSKDRNGYLEIVAGPGEVIYAVSVVNAQNGDGFVIDHLLFEPAPPGGGVAAPPGDAGATPPSELALLVLTDDLASLVYEYAIAPTGDPRAVSIFPAPSANGSALSPWGELFVGDFAGGGVSRFLLPFGVPRDNGRLTAPDLARPEQLVFVGNELWVLSSDLTGSRAPLPLVRFGFDAKGVATERPAIVDNLAGANRGIVWNSAKGDVYVSQCCGLNQILHLHLDHDGSSFQLAPLTSPDLSSPHGMVLTPGGELLVASYDNARLVRFTLNGEGEGTPNGFVEGNGLSKPVGLALAPWGEVWVANQGNSVLSRFSLDANGDLAAHGSFLTSAVPPSARTGWIQIVEAPVGCAPPTSPTCQAMRPAPVEPRATDGGVDAPADAPTSAADAASPPADGGARDAAKDATSPATKSGCGCRVPGGEGGPSALALGLVAVVLARSRRAGSTSSATGR